MSNSRHRIRTHIRSSWSCSFALFYAMKIVNNFITFSYIISIHTCIAHPISHFRHSLLRQSLLGNYHGFHKVSCMLIISQTPLRFIPEYTELVRTDSQEPRRLFDHGFCVVITWRALYRSYLELFVWSFGHSFWQNSLIGIIVLMQNLRDTSHLPQKWLHHQLLSIMNHERFKSIFNKLTTN